AAEPKWTVHETSDVAAIHLNPAKALYDLILPRAILSDYLFGRLEAPPRERPVLTIGFPRGLGAVFRGPGGKLSPISRQSNAVSGLITLRRFDTKTPSTFFLLDSPSIGGFSGSPVFITAGTWSAPLGLASSRHTALIGLIHGTVNDDQDGKQEGRLTA